MIQLITTKGRFQGSAAECGAWLAEMQPSSVRAERGEVSAEVEVQGTPGARTYERAIEAALTAEAPEMTAAAARDLGREHGAAVPASPADPEQARSDRNACRALRGASQDAQDAYLEGHLQGQAE